MKNTDINVSTTAVSQQLELNLQGEVVDINIFFKNRLEACLREVNSIENISIELTNIINEISSYEYNKNGGEEELEKINEITSLVVKYMLSAYSSNDKDFVEEKRNELAKAILKSKIMYMIRNIKSAIIYIEKHSRIGNEGIQ